jgi:bifunctional UDP-N-acetylglucosamine pyrophosphorylase/glucosamine-1-phosphate N-acetyltransferase
MDVPNPKGYGRLVRDEVRGELHRIVEERDATDEIRKLTLCNSGVVFGERQVMFDLLADLRPANAQAEYYLTDVFGLGRERGVATRVYTAPDWTEFLGVNDREQLAHIEGLMRSRQSK